MFGQFRHSGARLAVLAFLLAVVPAARGADGPRYEGVERIVAVGDIHGAYDELLSVLQVAGIADTEGRWSAGRAHFVSVGDVVDRGARSREVMDFLMQLEAQAREAGGRVHVLIGNHDAMNVSGELRYVSDGEFAAFAGEETARQRQAGFESWVKAQGRSPDDAARAEFDAQFPPGYFGHRAAFAPDGRYGSWVLSRPIAVVVNDTAFVHGGLTEYLDAPAELNARLPRELDVFARTRQQLIDAGILDRAPRFSAMRSQAKAALETADAATKPVIETFLEAGKSLVFDVDGPLWYRGTSLCHPYIEVLRTQAVLDKFGARRVALGHTTTPDRRIHERMNGRVLMIDTGMLTPVYEGRPAALVIEAGKAEALYADGTTLPIEPLPRQVGDRPEGFEGITDDQIETALREGTIVAKEAVGTGVTQPNKLTIEHEGLRVSALFKTESTDIESGSRRQMRRAIENSDRWQYEVAAYRLDRLLGLNLVPVTVERTVDGRTGSLQFWVGEIVSELKRQKEEIPAKGWCPLPEQWQLMYVFDGLVYNTDRTLQNIVYDADSWMLYLIDHSRGFRLETGLPPDLAKAEARISADFAAALKALDDESLHRELGAWLTRDQIRAILKRRDTLLSRWGP
jgi:hypothetical protein